MIFSSTVFLFLFLPLVLCVYYNPFVKNLSFRNTVLLLASLGFYAFGEPVFVFLMVLSVAVTHGSGLLLDRAENPKTKRRILAWSIGWHVAVLFVFKYLSFLLSQLGLLTGRDITFALPLPIGISFFTFQMMSCLFDIYYGKAKAQKNILNTGLYISFFPQLVAGPIVRYDQFARQIMNRQTTSEDLTCGMQRFLSGLGKKVLFANYLAVIADNIFDVYAPQGCSAATAWLGAVAYTLQIYFDFSGYSDMAIGMGRMFGFSFPENFNYPYAAANVTDFWRRWHISLGSWFRDYVYIPLGGNRVSAGRRIFNLFAVWLLTGIWHGANWTFLLWGLFYFLLLFMEKTTHFDKKAGVFSHVYTLAAVCLAWVVFRAKDLPAALSYLLTMFGVGAASAVDTVFTEYIKSGGILLLSAALLCFPVAPYLKERFQTKRCYFLTGFGSVALFVLEVFAVVGESYNPFIYFNF